MLNIGNNNLICVLGPTASGKTRYAVRLARELGNCEIISADSRQVYRRMDIGTGKDIAEYGDIPFHLIDIVEPGTQYNVFRFKEDFGRVLGEIRSRGAFPILCGGTGLYINAVTRGYDFHNNIPLSAPRNSVAAVSLGEMPETYFIGILVDRQTRNERIDRRLDARLGEGLVEEVKGLLAGGIPEETLISYGLEYKFITLYLRGEMTFEDMRMRLATAIHQFAKRQMTWFRGMERSGVRIHWVSPEGD